VATYFVNSLASLSRVLDALQPTSPFYHYSAGDPLRHGLGATHAAFLVALVLGAAVLAVVAVERRDFRT